MTITDFTNEAKDNVKFLYTLQKHCEPLYKCNPVSTRTHVRALGWINQDPFFFR